MNTFKPSPERVNDSNITTIDNRNIETAAILQMVTHMSDRLASMDAKLDTHMREETITIASEMAKLLLAAFPDGDAASHKRQHEANLKNAEARAEFMATLAKELSKYGLLGFLGWAAYTLWHAAVFIPK